MCGDNSILKLVQNFYHLSSNSDLNCRPPNVGWCDVAEVIPMGVGTGGHRGHVPPNNFAKKIFQWSICTLINEMGT